MTDRTIAIPNNDSLIAGLRADGQLGVYDCDGNPIFSLWGDPGDKMIAQIYMIQRRAFEHGVEVGESSKADEIRMALGIEASWTQ